MNLVESILEAKSKRKAPVIAEIKRIIPKLADEQGKPKDERSAAEIARMYQEGGAIGISLVTETTHFGGQPEEDVPAVLQSTSLPLLIKDFMLNEERVNYYIRLVSSFGKDYLSRVVLLLTTHWLGKELPTMLSHVHNNDMLALVETRKPEDLSYLDGSSQSPRLVGINNKNIDELEKGEDQVKLPPELISQYRGLLSDCLLISQSAHRRPEDVRRSIKAGADAVLVGTAFMVTNQPVKMVASFVHALERQE